MVNVQNTCVGAVDSCDYFRGQMTVKRTFSVAWNEKLTNAICVLLPAATGVSLPQALGKLLEQGSELAGLWE